MRDDDKGKELLVKVLQNYSCDESVANSIYSFPPFVAIKGLFRS